MIKDISYLCISDIHLGNSRNKTSDILTNLTKFFDDFTSKSSFTELDIIFIAGDLFDTLLDFSSSDIHEITLWLNRLIVFCNRYKIKLRVLEGTPSHDWKQSKIINTLININEENYDVRYIEGLSIEHLKDLGLYILYIQDELTESATSTYKLVTELLNQQGIEKVDIAIMHGMFNYQVKGAIHNVQKHNEQDYLDIVKYYINIGHVHTFSSFDRILANGSFDRLSHGEEEPKGGVLCRIINDELSFSFIENKGAKIFKTIEIKYKDIDKALLYLDKKIKDLPNNSCIRIKASKDHPIYNSMNEFKIRYPFFNFSKLSNEDNDESSELINISINANIEYKPISITEDNIFNLLNDRIRSKYDLTIQQQIILNNILEETN